MGIETYERPREKLRSKGAGVLSLVELFHVIIGTGGGAASGSKLAREVLELHKRQNITYLSLRTIKGLGDAKACQILAAVELAGRIGRLDA